MVCSVLAWTGKSHTWWFYVNTNIQNFFPAISKGGGASRIGSGLDSYSIQILCFVPASHQVMDVEILGSMQIVELMWFSFPRSTLLQQALPTIIGTRQAILPPNQRPALSLAPSSCKVRSFFACWKIHESLVLYTGQKKWNHRQGGVEMFPLLGIEFHT